MNKKWTFVKIPASAWNLTSELRKKWTLNVQYIFMKIHASAWQCIESHIFTKKKMNFESSIFFHENSCKCIESQIWTKKKVNFESSMFFHENSCKCIESHWKFNIFSWKIHASPLNLTSELRKKWTLKVQYFSWKCMTMHWISHLN